MEGDLRIEENEMFIGRAVNAAVRIGLVAGLIWWCFLIVSPFMMMVIWAVIYSVTLYPMFGWLKTKMGDKGGLAATVIALVALSVLIVPIVMLSMSTISAVEAITTGIEQGTFEVPPPAASVADWPVVGEKLFDAWSLASSNLQLFMGQYQEQLQPLGAFVVAQAAGAGAAILVFVLAILIGGLMMAKADAAVSGTIQFVTRLTGKDGEAMVKIAGGTIRSVVQGVLGVAVIQSLLSGVGMLVMDVPGAGLWAGVILILAVMQVPPLLVLGPVIAYVFTTTSTVPAMIFMVFAILVSVSDTFLKPLFLGRGVAVPMPVILIGAIGGMILSGIVGLFVGAVILALAYQMVIEWTNQGAEETALESE